MPGEICGVVRSTVALEISRRAEYSEPAARYRASHVAAVERRGYANRNVYAFFDEIDDAIRRPNVYGHVGVRAHDVRDRGHEVLAEIHRCCDAE